MQGKKNDKLDFTKVKTVKRTVKNFERQATDQEKIFVKHISDKGLISKYTPNS